MPISARITKLTFGSEGKKHTFSTYVSAAAQRLSGPPPVKVWELLLAGEPPTPLAGLGQGPEGYGR